MITQTNDSDMNMCTSLSSKSSLGLALITGDDCGLNSAAQVRTATTPACIRYGGNMKFALIMPLVCA